MLLNILLLHSLVLLLTLHDIVWCYTGGRHMHAVSGSAVGHRGKRFLTINRLYSTVDVIKVDGPTHDHTISVGPYQILSYNDLLELHEDVVLPNNTIRLVDIRSGWGNGAHPTTQLCLDFVLSKVMRDDVFLDYGCGSGILSILAAKLGASRCMSVDIDEDSLTATRTNAAINGVVEVLQVVHTKEVYIGEGGQRLADVAVANILPGPLSRLGTSPVRRTTATVYCTASNLSSKQLINDSLLWISLYHISCSFVDADQAGWISVPLRAETTRAVGDPEVS
jgi:SAM-dependent methyltransferase